MKIYAKVYTDGQLQSIEISQESLVDFIEDYTMNKFGTYYAEVKSMVVDTVVEL